MPRNLSRKNKHADFPLNGDTLVINFSTEFLDEKFWLFFHKMESFLIVDVIFFVISRFRIPVGPNPNGKLYIYNEYHLNA